MSRIDLQSRLFNTRYGCPERGRVAAVATWVATRQSYIRQMFKSKKEARPHPPGGHHYRTLVRVVSPPRSAAGATLWENQVSKPYRSCANAATVERDVPRRTGGTMR